MKAVHLVQEIPPSQIGERLRDERIRKKMTAREIARRVGVSPSLISQIERNKVNPSVSTLWSLVTVLGISMGDLFAEVDAEPRHVAGPRVVAAGPDTPTTKPGERAVIYLEQGVMWERLTADRDAMVEFLTITYPPGAASCDENSLVRHSGKEYGYVLKGVLRVQIGFDEYELRQGMAISFDASSPHRLSATGEQTVEALWVVVGRQSDGRALVL
ncbi:MAG TPA: cupin domain-containing protein [Gaiellaceae bacterium]|nr:cupin domain-containing protein [Gaiellaceae bacterium]